MVGVLPVAGLRAATGGAGPGGSNVKVVVGHSRELVTHFTGR